MTYAGVYVHIPFCRAKCAYCDFISSANCESSFSPYLQALERELTLRVESWQTVRFDSLYLGGGTPTVLPPLALTQLLELLLDHLDVSSDAEITLEANPGTVGPTMLRALRVAGYNRLSLGFQSLEEAELTTVGRIHTPDEALAAWRHARAAGFDNVNVDLMYGLPGQTLTSWRSSLQRVLLLRPEHLSLYGLTLEEGTPLAKRVASGELPLPDDDLAADMYELACALLNDAGYAHYEISNWALGRGEGADEEVVPALASRHNLKYWHNACYLGLGLAAHSYDGRRRTANVTDLSAYIARLSEGQMPVEMGEEPTLEQRLGETMMLGLRLSVGVSWEAFRSRFGLELEQVYGKEIRTMQEDGLLDVDGRGIRLTPRGRLLGNQVFGAFVR
ncbi:MAG: radical SAM family heme chaperone HemW [Anaerolineae bacterium]